MTIDKVINPGTVPSYNGNRMRVFCRIKFDGSKLSISGVEGPKANGNATGSCGQIAMGYAHRDPADNDARYSDPTSPEDFNFSSSWTADLWLDFLDVWKRWHMNDMRAECEHQRTLGWTYATHAGQSCPECSYKIGTEWKSEDVPQDVLDFLDALPSSTKTPAWV